MADDIELLAPSCPACGAAWQRGKVRYGCDTCAAEIKRRKLIEDGRTPVPDGVWTGRIRQPRTPSR